MSVQNIRLTGLLIGAAVLLSIPFIAMKTVGGFNWSGFDFAIVGVMLLATVLAIEFVLRKVKKTAHRLALCAAIMIVLAIVWAELAVGLIGTPLAGS